MLFFIYFVWLSSNFNFLLVVQALIVLGHQHQRSRNLMEVIRLQHEEIVAKGKEVKSLDSRVTEVEGLLECKDADLERKDVELESRADELERVRTFCGQLEGKLEDTGQENLDLRGQNSTLLRRNEELVATAQKDKEAAKEYYKDLLFDDFYHVWKLNKPLDLTFLSEYEEVEELANFERRAREEAAEEAAAVQATVASSSASLPETTPVTEVVEEPMIVEVADVSMDDLPL